MNMLAVAANAGRGTGRCGGFSSGFEGPKKEQISQPIQSAKNPRFQRRTALFLGVILLAFLGVFWYNALMLKQIEIALEIVVKNNDFDRLNSALRASSPAHPARVLSPLVRPVLLPVMRHCEQVASVPKEHSSGFGAAMRRNACAALLRQPGTHPRRMRSAVF